MATGLSILSFHALAGTLSDLWWNPLESGWGVNVAQQNDVLFLTMFVYGADGKPTWFVGPNTLQQGFLSPTYTGTLYATAGPVFSGPFNPAAVTNREVGTVTFTAAAGGKASLAYTVDGVQVQKSVERQTWRTIPFGELSPLPDEPRNVLYVGTFQVTEMRQGTVCSGGLDPFSSASAFELVPTPTDGRSGTMELRVGSELVLAGTYVQNGSIFTVALSGTVAANGLTHLPAGRYDGGIDPLTVEGNFAYGYLRVSGDNGCRMAFALAGHIPGLTQFP